jgi:hypothetical protein
MSATLRIAMVSLVAVVSCKAKDTAEPTTRHPYAPPTGPCEVGTEPTELATLRDRQECKRSGDATPVDPSAVTVSLSPAPLEIAEGERGKVTVFIANATDGPLELDFDLSCDPWQGFTLMASDSTGERRHPFAEGVLAGERWQVFMVEDEGCARFPVRVVVPPGGKLSMPIEFDPTMEWENRGLHLVDERTFGAGQYALQSEVPLAATSPVVAKGTLRVTAASPPADEAPPVSQPQ